MTKEKEENKIQPIIKGPSLGYTDNFPKREMWWLFRSNGASLFGQTVPL